MPVVAGLSVSRALRFASVMTLVVPAASQAATVELRPGRYSEAARIVTFTTAAGERNTVTARFISDAGGASLIWQITDATATVTAVAPRAQIDEHNVSRPSVVGGYFEGAAFTLGDGDDTLDVDADSNDSSGNVRLAARRDGVRAVVRVHFKDGPSPIDQAVLYAWMIRLKARP